MHDKISTCVMIVLHVYAIIGLDVCVQITHRVRDNQYI